MSIGLVARAIPPSQWLWLVGLLAFYCVCVSLLFAFGRTEGTPSMWAFPFHQISNSLRRLTGFPGWAMGGALTALLFLLIAVIGFYWDVAWHIDLGRDKNLFTPPHVMILVGLWGISFAGVVTAVMATVDGVRIPRSAMVLALLGVLAATAFPIDNLYHKAYGLDITLWSPSHLQLVTGGGFGTLGVLLLLAESLPRARPTLLGRGILVLAVGAALVGMSVFLGEFDYGVPQFQLVFLPILVAAAAGFTLVLARLALGPWGAVKATGVYLVLRGVIALVVAGSLHHTFPRFPLYLAPAVAVEVAALLAGTDRRLRFALVAGALVGTFGLAGELVWIGLSGYGPVPASLLPRTVLLAIPAALAAAVLGGGLARAFAPRAARIPAAGVGLACVVLLTVLIIPLHRGVGHVDAVIRLDRTQGRAHVQVGLLPADAAKGAAVFGVLSWQGGGTVRTALDQVRPGHYVSKGTVPVDGSWKSMLVLYRGDEVMAAPIYLPADPQIRAAAIPAVARRHVSFVRNTKVLLREAKPGPPLPATLAYGVWGASIVLWVGLMAFTAARAGERAPEEPSRAPSPGGRTVAAGA
ncbi:MAG: hypothetical protein QOE44_1894 [Solirubrobacteraceae bacterium]|nr:hypothetical protein [Solirubrobacteraceae bacterium]